MNGPHLFTHLKPATFYKARDFFVPLSADPTSQLLKIALVLVRFDHVASCIRWRNYSATFSLITG